MPSIEDHTYLITKKTKEELINEIKEHEDKILQFEK